MDTVAIEKKYHCKDNRNNKSSDSSILEDVIDNNNMELLSKISNNNPIFTPVTLNSSAQPLLASITSRAENSIIKLSNCRSKMSLTQVVSVALSTTLTVIPGTSNQKVNVICSSSSSLVSTVVACRACGAVSPSSFPLFSCGFFGLLLVFPPLNRMILIV